MLENYVVLDLEMTGLSPRYDKIIEIGLIKVRQNRVAEQFVTLIYPDMPISQKISEITGITDEMLANQPRIEDKIAEVIEFLKGEVLIGHSLQNDFAFLMQACYQCGIYSSVRNEKWMGIDTLEIAKKCVDVNQSKSLEALCKLYGIEDKQHHRAVNDARITGQLYEKLCGQYENGDRTFLPKSYTYKIKKDRIPTKRDLERLDMLVKKLNIKDVPDFSIMTQSEVYRYYDKIKSLGRESW